VSYPTTDTPADCEECADPLDVPRHVRKRFCGQECYRAKNRRKPSVRERAALTLKRRRARVIGRECKWCGAGDAAGAWSNNMTECAKCSRQRQRMACGVCGGPWYFSARKARKWSGCVLAYQSEMLPGELCKDYLRAPRNT